MSTARHPSLAAVTLVAALSACSADLVCGPGTQHKQLADGRDACVPVTVAKGDTTCDADGGVRLEAGNQCVSVVQCGAGTVLDAASQTCVPVARAAHEPDVCPQPAAGHICVNGTLRNFVDGSFLSGQTVQVQVFDPQSFIGSATPTPLGATSASDTFTLPNLTTPTSGYFLVVTGDPSGAAATYAATAIGGTAVDGHTARVDGYVLGRAQLAAWSSAAGSDYDANGALVYRFFSDPPPPTSARTPTETQPVAGVQLIDTRTGQPPSGARYFGAALTTINPALTATSTVGGAIVSSTGIATYSGRGGGVATWEAHASMGVAHLVQIDFLHPQP